MKIKYDRRTTKVLLITTIVSLLLFLTGIIVMYFEITGLALLFLFGIYAGGGLLIYSLLNLVCAVCYFRRLKMHGYEVPYDRNRYGNDLKNVPNSYDSGNISFVGFCICKCMEYLLHNSLVSVCGG